MIDPIERQAAIDALKEHRALFCDNTPDTFSKLSYGEKCRVDELDTAISTLVNLPSAQPNLQQSCNQLATDCISRQAAIDAANRADYRGLTVEDVKKVTDEVVKEIKKLPSAQSDNGYSDGFTNGYKRGLTDAQPDNQINLCDSCDYSYPDCPSESDDVIFGNGIGNDNICACNKYKPSAQPEPCLDLIVSEIEETIRETRENGKHHDINVRTNGEMICFGLQLALEIIEEKRNERFDK